MGRERGDRYQAARDLENALRLCADRKFSVERAVVRRLLFPLRFRVVIELVSSAHAAELAAVML